MATLYVASYEETSRNSIPYLLAEYFVRPEAARPDVESPIVKFSVIEALLPDLYLPYPAAYQ